MLRRDISRRFIIIIIIVISVLRSLAAACGHLRSLADSRHLDWSLTFVFAHHCVWYSRSSTHHFSSSSSSSSSVGATTAVGLYSTALQSLNNACRCRCRCRSSVALRASEQVIASVAPWPRSFSLPLCLHSLSGQLVALSYACRERRCAENYTK